MKIQLISIFLLVPLFISAQTATKIDPVFHYVADKSEAFKSDELIRGSIRFNSPPGILVIRELEEAGVRFSRSRGAILHSATVYPARIPYSALERLADNKNIAYVECGFRPVRRPPLWISRVQTGAVQTWNLRNRFNLPVTGNGILVADFDTGVDYYHPMLWFADGDTLDWIDVNGNDAFDPGKDAVDLNRNGSADAGELLAYEEFKFSGNDEARYDADLDWLFNDANGDSVRNFGRSAGFDETSPCYGEQWFLSLDENGNNELDPGEKLVGLKTSKVRAIRDRDGTVYRRGIDLIDAPADTGPYGGHGTAVAGILCGGAVSVSSGTVKAVKKLTGLAPGAEMIFASIEYQPGPRFYTDLPEHLAWAASEGAKVFLYEDGEWVWEYLDGSSNGEIMINELARDSGTVHIIPAGNLNTGRVTKTATIAPGDTLELPMTVRRGVSTVWPTLLWQGREDDLRIAVRNSAGDTVSLPADGSTVPLAPGTLYAARSISSRGTIMWRLEMAQVDTSIYTFLVANTTGKPIELRGLIGDNVSGWYGRTQWVKPTYNNSVTWPCTADSGIGIAAYNPRGDRKLNGFSGRGYRIDGFTPVDIACPGSVVYSIGKGNRYVAFGGTSSAGPHGAAAAALLLELNPTLRNGDVEQLLRSGAVSDSITGIVPNTAWGAGRLNIFNAARLLTTSVRRPASGRSGFSITGLYPHPVPSGSTAYLDISLSKPADVQFKLFNTLGRRIAVFTYQAKSNGRRQVALPVSGLSRGVYLLSISVENRAQSLMFFVQ